MVSRLLILCGIGLICIGVVVKVLGSVPWLGKLPGDLLVKKGSFTFYFPLATCLLMSVVMILICMLFARRQ